MYQVIITWRSMNPDGMAYLDFGDRIWSAGWLAAVAGTNTRLMRSVLPALATSTAVLVTFWVLVDTPATEIQRRKITGKDKAANLQVAIVLKQLGFHAGDPFGSIGDAFNAYWARLDRLRVVAEIPREDANLFWAAEPVRQAQIIEAFRRTGACAIIATNYYIYELHPPGTH